MRWMIAVGLALGIGTAHADQWVIPIPYEKLLEDGFQVIGVTPDGRGGQVYHLQKQGAPLFTCHAKVLVPGVKPFMEKYCSKVM